MSARSWRASRIGPVALIALGYMFLTNLDSIFVIPLLPVLHGGGTAAIARDVAFALSLRLVASLLLSLLLPVLAPRAGNAAVLLAASLLKAAGFACLIVLSAPIGLWCFALLAGAGCGAGRRARAAGRAHPSAAASGQEWVKPVQGKRRVAGASGGRESRSFSTAPRSGKGCAAEVVWLAQRQRPPFAGGHGGHEVRARRRARGPRGLLI